MARCWARVWAALNGIEVRDRLPDAAETVLRDFVRYWSFGREPPEHWFTTLADERRKGEIREVTKRVTADVTA